MDIRLVGHPQISQWRGLLDLLSSDTVHARQGAHVHVVLFRSVDPLLLFPPRVLGTLYQPWPRPRCPVFLLLHFSPIIFIYDFEDPDGLLAFCH